MSSVSRIKRVGRPGFVVVSLFFGAALMLAALAWVPAIVAPGPSRAELALVADPAKRIELSNAATKLQNDVRGTAL